MAQRPHSSQIFDTPQGTAGVLVRRATKADVEAALTIVDEVEAGANDALRAKGVEPVPTRAIVERFIGRHELLMAEDRDGRVVGVVRVEDTGWAVELGWLVCRDRLGTGVATAIVETVALRLMDNGYGIVTAQASASSPGARRMLGDYGFKLLKTPSGRMRYVVGPESWNEADAKRGGKPPVFAQPDRKGGGISGEQGVLVDPGLRAPKPVKARTIADAFEPSREADGLRMRPADLSDIPALLAVTDGQVDHRGKPADPDDMIQPILRGNIVVAEDASGRVVGSVSYRHASWRNSDGVEIGWIVAPDMRRRGIGATMAREALERMFEIGCPRVTCKVLLGNDASHRIAESLGMDPKPAEHGFVTYSLKAVDRVPAPGMTPA